MSAPAPWKIRSISSMRSSKSPRVEGFVSISPAVRDPTFPCRSSTSMLPRASVLTPTSSYPAMVTLARLAAVGEVGAHQHQARQLALRAGRRLKRDGVEAAHLGEDLLEAPHQLERPLGAVFLLERVQVLEARQHDEPLVDPRVVLHRARSER